MINKINDFRNYVFNKLNIASILSLSFLFVIIIGTIFLSLPISNKKEVLPIIDNLFTATSATCVTGLLTTIVSEQYSNFGKFIILILIQIGGLGLMTFISVLLLFLKAKLQFKERMLLKDALNKTDFSNIKSYIISIVKYTITFEMIGAIIFMFILCKYYDLYHTISYSIFLSISSFCNAGIDPFGAISLISFSSEPLLLITVAMLIIFGGLGFGVWFDYRANLNLLIKKNKTIKFNIHTKLVTKISLYLILIGTILIFIFEYNNSLSNLNIFDKLINAFFSSVTLRTAGFYSVDFTILRNVTCIIMIIFMLIGGSPGGTAGGIKTTTFFLLIYAIYNEFKGNEKMNLYRRHISDRNFKKAYLIFAFYLFFIIFSIIILSISETFDTLDIVYEIVSAIGTVGLTTGITTQLSLVGKMVIIFLMFIGRIGPITIAYSLRNKKQDLQIKYPEIEILVG